MRLLRLVSLLILLLIPKTLEAAGVPTVGNVGSGADFTPMNGEGPQDALKRCLLNKGVAHFLPGTYQFTDEMAGTFNNIRITGSRGAVLKPATTGTVGLFDLIGDNIVIDGITVRATTFTANQTWIRFRPGAIYSAATIAADNDTVPTPDTNDLTDSANGFLTAGFAAGDTVAIRGFTGNGAFANHGTGVIESVTAGLMRLALTITLVDDAAGETVTITQLGTNKGHIVSDCQFHAAWSSVPTVYTENVVPAGSNSTPVTMIEFDNAIEKTVKDCSFLPDLGTICIASYDGMGPRIVNNTFGNQMDAGINPVTDSLRIVPRLCKQCIVLDGEEWGQVNGNKFWSLGHGDDSVEFFDETYSLENALLIRGYWNGTGTVENGHFVINDNIAEGNTTAKQFEYRAATSVNMTGNMLGFINVGTDYGPNDLGEACIVFTDGNNGGSGTDVVFGANIMANDIHNSAYPNSAGAAIFAQSTSDLNISGNAITAMQSDYAIQLSGSTCESVAISGNTFRGNESNCTAPVHVNLGTGVTNGLVVSGNNQEGFASMDCVVNDSSSVVDYYLHGLREQLKGDSSATLQISATNDIAAADTNTLTSTALFAGLAVGDHIVIHGFTGSAASIAANNYKLLQVSVFTSSSQIDVLPATLVADAATAAEVVTITKIPAQVEVSGTDIDASDTNTLISTAKFLGLKVGDTIVCSGFGTATTNNNVYLTVSVFTSTSSIDVLPAILTADATGTVVVREVNAKPFTPFYCQGTDISADETGGVFTITCATASSPKFTGLAVGDTVLIEGFTGTVANNGMRYVTSIVDALNFTVSGTVAAGTAVVDDAAGELVTIKKLVFNVSGNVALD